MANVLYNPGSFQPQHPSQASTRLRLRVKGLPPQTSTLDIYENFHRYGSVVRIYLHETRTGHNSTRADIDFQPAPDQDFRHKVLLFETRSHQSAKVSCEPLDDQPQTFTKGRPLRKGVRYDDRMEMNGKALEFGVLVEPTKMMVMGRSGSMEHSPKLVLNLYRKEIEVHFPWQQISSNRSAVRTFRFKIALDGGLKIWQLPDHSFVLHLAKPPWYSKQLAEAIANTHSPDDHLWTIEDTWARQTDLWTYKQRIPEINGSPVALPKYLNDINIFRWTTFRFEPVDNDSSMSTAKILVDALSDRNVKVLDGKFFETVQSKPELDKKAWTLINSTHLDKNTVSATEIPQVKLPFAVRYQLEVCLSHGWLSEYSITSNFLKQLSQLPERRAKQSLLYIAMDQKRLFDPMKVFEDIHYSKPVRARRLPDNCIEICSATVTTTGILFNTPAVEITNRIIRKHKSHAHRFLRVRFEDDEYRGQTRLYPSPNNKMIMIFTRVKRALKHGIKLGNVLYEFLAWSNSQIREHGVYFFAGMDGLTADSIRAEMGQFKEVVVAKKAARMGQCFSTTRPVHLQLETIHEIDTIPDIVRNGYTFTDGVGKISRAAAELVARQLQMKGPTPCLFQFRLGGCKGVLAVSDDVPGVNVRIRKSQHKFMSLDNELEINRYAQFWQPCLNHQIILCLYNLGVPTRTFIRKQDEIVATLNRAMCDDGVAINALRSNVDPNMMTLELSHLIEAGFRQSQEPFVVSLLGLWRAWSLKYLKEKSRIPIEEGAFVLGTVDETATLQGHTRACPSGDMDTIMADPARLKDLPEIFIQITDHKTGHPRIIEGICILARNPSLHRGDIRVVRARNVPALHHMQDVVVMPQLGDRDLPSMCSGGDLDGDDYIVIWDRDLIPQFWNAEPFHYEPPTPKTATGEITTNDLIDFFSDYLQNDALGRIANAHKAAADFFDDGLESAVCLELAQLHSMAVDYPKTGVPAKMERRLERPDKPHFMESPGRSYISRKVLGQLYDKVNKFYESLRKDTFVKHELEFDKRILNAFEPGSDLLSEVEAVKRGYDVSLQRILTQHSIGTEFEVWSTFVLEHSKKSRDFKFHEEIGDLSKVLKEEYYEELCDLAGGRDFDHLAPVAVAAYRLTQKQHEAAKLRAHSRTEDEADTDMPFISFPWILQETLIKIASQSYNHNEQGTAQRNSGAENLSKQTMDFAEEHTKDELHNVADFRLTRDKLSPYLPDPLVANIVVSPRDDAGNPAATTPLQSAEEEESVHTDCKLLEETNTTRNANDILNPLANESPTSLPNESRDSITLESPSEISGHHLKASNSTHPLEGVHRSSSVESESPRPRESSQQDMLDNRRSERPQTLTTRLSPSGKMQPRSPMDRRRLRQATCFYWRTNDLCRYSEQECKYAHHETGVDMLEKQQATCYYWLNRGKCIFNDETCKFAHYDTGYHAPQPLGSISSKGRKSPSTRRVIAVDSGSDDGEFLTHSARAYRGPRPARTGSQSDASAVRQEQVNGRNGQQSQVYTDLDSDMASKSYNMMCRSPVRPKTSQMVIREEQSTPCSNDVACSHGISSQHESPPKHLELNSQANMFISNTSDQCNTSPKRTSSRTQTATQLRDAVGGAIIHGTSSLISYGSDNKVERKSEKNDFSWTDDLQGLIFGDKAATLPTPEESNCNGGDLSTTKRVAHKDYVPSLYGDLIDLTLEVPEQATLPTRKVVSQKPSTSVKTPQPESYSDSLIKNPGTTKVTPLRDLGDAESSPYTSLLLDEFSTVDGNTKPKISISTSNTFGDPLESDGAHDEPEIEELLD